VIRTVTLNTGFDETIRVGPVDAGGVGDLLERATVPSGKGINSARTIRALGMPVVAYGLVGAAETRVFHEALAAEGVDARLVAVPQRTRTNVTIAPASGGSAHYRAPGFTLTDTAPLQALLSALERDVAAGDIVSLHGSTPEGAPVETWSMIAAAVSACGALVLADIYGEPLVRLLARVKVLACKPNAVEMTVLPGASAGVAGAAAAVRHLHAAGVEVPLVTLGSAGLVFADAGAVSQASLDPRAVVQTVGAGDACMGGLTVALAGGTRSRRDVARAAIAAAVAHVEGTAIRDRASRASELARQVQFTVVEGPS
jgi:1-phosphofructokinase family hexose kinase